jgi:hypothetical protein
VALVGAVSPRKPGILPGTLIRAGAEAGTLERMTSYSGFFGASAGTAGALIGLLFVALSVSPERLREITGNQEHQAVAATAFTALVDALFVSLGGLTIGGGTQTVSVVTGVFGLTSTMSLAIRLWRSRHEEHLSRRWPSLLGVIAVMYTAQAILVGTAGTAAASDSLSTTFIFIMFTVGIGRSWELLGLRGGGLLDLLASRPGQRKPSGPSE